MTKIKLTPKQTDLLLNVFTNWGVCFHGFSVHHSLLREPIEAELESHFKSETEDLNTTHDRLIDALTMREYAEVERLASRAKHIAASLTEEDREYGLYCLTDAAKAFAEKTIAKRAAETKRFDAENAAIVTRADA